MIQYGRIEANKIMPKQNTPVAMIPLTKIIEIILPNLTFQFVIKNYLFLRLDI